jgi:hypothetical protein
LKASSAVLGAIVGLATAMLGSVPADAPHKQNCGGRMVQTGIFIGVYIQPGSGQKTAASNSVKQMCKGELMDKAKLSYGPKVTSIEKFGVGCILQKEGNPYSKYWCVCSGEPCWPPKAKIWKKDYKDGLERRKSREPFSMIGPFPGLRAPSRTPSTSLPSLRRR